VTDRSKAIAALTLSTVAFTVCFAVWMMNGVLITFLVDSKVFAFDKTQMGWLMGIPVLTGSVVRLPVGLATDRWGGRIVFPIVMLAAAAGAVMASMANSYAEFIISGLLFGLAGTGFAVGIAYTSVWFPMSQQGTALGIFGVGNAGSALTSLGGPALLYYLTQGGTNIEGWRRMPLLYAASLIVMAIIFFMFAENRVPNHGIKRTLAQQLKPLSSIRVWRFGLYYFLVFGAFVALAQWLIPYYLNVYAVTLATAGMLAAIFSLPSGLIRALGGWLSDRMGARTVMYWVLGTCVVGCLALVVPQMEITSPGEGIMAVSKGTVTSVSVDEIMVDDRKYALRPRVELASTREEGRLILPQLNFWHTAAVNVGDQVQKKQVLARGKTHIYFQANIWIFTALVFIVGIAMGIGKAAVYKHIPEYFPKDVGVVGGIVGVIGGLGGFFCPIWFGYMLHVTGLWTTTWMILFAVSIICLAWMHLVVRAMIKQKAPELAERFERESSRI
jgi:MFS transporter, NNP family, nitrate/nitrite transporter